MFILALATRPYFKSVLSRHEKPDPDEVVMIQKL
jgi:hypothetical protein